MTHKMPLYTLRLVRKSVLNDIFVFNEAEILTLLLITVSTNQLSGGLFKDKEVHKILVNELKCCNYYWEISMLSYWFDIKCITESSEYDKLLGFLQPLLFISNSRKMLLGNKNKAASDHGGLAIKGSRNPIELLTESTKGTITFHFITMKAINK